MTNPAQELEPGALDTDAILIRGLAEADLEAVVVIDAAVRGRRRPSYFARMLERAVAGADFQISLVAEQEGRVVGFVIATLYYGEFGVVEPSATIDTIGVHPDHQRRQVGRALVRQLVTNLAGLRIERLRTEVAWNDLRMLAFFESAGFSPSDRLCLERPIDPTSPES